ncbi:MAG: hypothetical protein E6K79_01605 [Candidatus Eisenbacteria bacterium]|uniref:UDP-3-O-[3-hydroxymyristoyl] glucosamine N-acyltransferase non-repeat region domain-containing protein n=1 Tax=Eiseniibacteriota bacterium TaxID=2212470 RepID=A0A538TSM9_UNCEI|nr:MAG: hypothetical protein E6K79_01605 [Candidatus Eisenbacteria bacterium]
MKVTLDTVAKAIDGLVVGDGTVEITGVAGIRKKKEGDLTFLANPKYEPYLACTHASAIIVAENHRNVAKPLIQNPNPYLAFLKAVRFFQGDEERPAQGVHATAVVAKDASGSWNGAFPWARARSSRLDASSAPARGSAPTRFSIRT